MAVIRAQFLRLNGRFREAATRNFAAVEGQQWEVSDGLDQKTEIPNGPGAIIVTTSRTFT